MFQEEIDVASELNEKQLNIISDIVIQNSWLEWKVEDNIDQFKNYLIEILSDTKMTEILKFSDNNQSLIFSFYKYLTNLEKKEKKAVVENAEKEKAKEEEEKQEDLVKTILNLEDKKNKDKIKKLFFELNTYWLKRIHHELLSIEKTSTWNNNKNSISFSFRNLLDLISNKIIADMFFEIFLNNRKYMYTQLKYSTHNWKTIRIKFLEKINYEEYLKFKSIIYINITNITDTHIKKNFFAYIKNYIKARGDANDNISIEDFYKFTQENKIRDNYKI